jgi:hypothetical protein
MGQSAEAISEEADARRLWERHINSTVDLAQIFLSMDIAKQQVNFLLQDLAPLTEIITATDWSNFYALRCELHPDGTPVARPEVYRTADAIRAAIEGSAPVKRELHIPMLTEHELAPGGLSLDYLVGVSAGRCAKISYGDFDWTAEDRQISYNRSRKLLSAGHMSPFEQQATAFDRQRWGVIEKLQEVLDNFIEIGEFPGLTATEITEMRRQLEYSGNLHGWVPARKMYPYEYDYSLLKQTMGEIHAV